jgi:hypothetical protein
MTGNTLLEGHEGGNLNGDSESIESENIIVVAFYLISRESGVLFHKISDLVFTFERIRHGYTVEFETAVYSHEVLK